MTENRASIPGTFFESAQRCPDKPAFVLILEQERRDITYGEIVRQVKALSASLASSLKKGDRVVIYSENRPEWCVAYLAVSSLGCVAVPVDAEMGSDELATIVRESGASLIFSSDRKSRTLAGLPHPGGRVISFDDGTYRELAGADPEGFALRDIEAEDLASIIYTSGTTGVPKGVMLSHENFLSDARGIRDARIVTAADNVLCVLPLHHTYAFMCTFLVPFFVGATVTYPPSLKGPDLARAIGESRVTILVGVPQLLDIFYSSIRKSYDRVPAVGRALGGVLFAVCGFSRGRLNLNLGRVLFAPVHRRFGRQFRILTSGGARLSPETMRGLEACGFTVLEGYGLTETSPVVTFNPPDRRKPGSVGKALPGVEIRVADPEDGGDGEVLIRGDMVMKGYYRMPSETENVLRDGWFHSGDLGRVDEEGYLFITGRKKDVIVLSSGKNVYPEELEKLYQDVPLIKEIGIFERHEGSRVMLHALIVPDFERARAEKIANIHEALKWEIHGVSLKVPPPMRLKGFSLRSDPLPRTRLGKLKRFRIGEIASAGETQREPRPSADEFRDPLGQKVAEALRSVMGTAGDVRPGDNLELDLGIDSLKRIELSVELEKTFSVGIPETFMLEIQSVAELTERVRTLLESGPGARPGQGRDLMEVMLREPDPGELRNLAISQGPLTMLFLRAALRIMRSVFNAYFRVEVTGAERIPEGPYILVSNHSSYLDSFLIVSHVPFRVFRNLFFQGAQMYFSSAPMRLFARLAHVIPIDPDAHLASALSLSAHVLRSGKALCIFPEGGRSFDGEIMPFRKGIGMLSAALGVPLVPVRLRGTFESMPRGRRIPRRVPLRMVVGEPLRVEEVRARGMEEQRVYQEIADAARQRVMAL